MKNIYYFLTLLFIALPLFTVAYIIDSIYNLIGAMTMKTIKIFNPSYNYEVPVILNCQYTCLILNIDYGFTYGNTSIHTFSITLKDAKTQYIVRLSNLKQAKKLTKVIDRWFIINNWTVENLDKNKLKDLLIEYVNVNNIHCVIGGKVYKPIK